MDNSVFDVLTNEQIIALCLYEMTWFGYTEEDIANRLNMLGNEEEINK
ncbi:MULTISPECIES: DUF6557 family protein [Paenibacillus]